MKRTILPLAAATAAALLTSLPRLSAAPFNPKDVAADPALLVHVDCDAINASTIGKSILSQASLQEKLAALGAIIDFDVRTQLHGFTIYTTEEHPKDGALIVYADFDPKRLITLAKAADDFRCVTNGEHVIYSWRDDKKKARHGEQPRVCGAIAGHRVLFGQDESQLANALDVIDGTAPNLSGKKGLPTAGAGESILLQGELVKFDFDDADGKAAIFKKAKSVRVKLSEDGDKVTAAVHLEAADDNTATEINAIAQGLLAVVKLQMPDADATKLANDIVIKQDGPVVGLTISEPSSELSGDVVKMIQKGEQKAEEKEAKKKAHDDHDAPENK